MSLAKQLQHLLVLTSPIQEPQVAAVTEVVPGEMVVAMCWLEKLIEYGMAIRATIRMARETKRLA
jgi:hypothetical protein